MIIIDWKNNEQECRTCKAIKDLSSFNKSKRYLSGYDSECKICKGNIQKKRQLVIKNRDVEVDYSNDFFTSDEVAVVLCISLGTLKRLHKYLKPIRKGKFYLFSKENIDNYLQDGLR